MPYSSIIRKHCCCSEDCRLYPSIGYKGYNEAHAPEELRQEKISRLKERAKKRNGAIKAGRALRVLAVTDDGNRKKVRRLKTAEELKESTDKINAQIDKAKSELSELQKKKQK